jgi:hypothetical protein
MGVVGGASITVSVLGARGGGERDAAGAGIVFPPRLDRYLAETG